jgi:hypothetical protein
MASDASRAEEAESSRCPQCGRNAQRVSDLWEAGKATLNSGLIRFRWGKRVNQSLLDKMGPPTQGGERRVSPWIVFWLLTLVCIVGAAHIMQLYLFGDAWTADAWARIVCEVVVAVATAVVATFVYPPISRWLATVSRTQAEARWRKCYACMDCDCAFLSNPRRTVPVAKIKTLLWRRS